MKEIVDRLKEKRQVELAKSILESKGYAVTKLNESSSYTWNRERNRFYDKGDPEEFLYYEPEGVRDRRTVVYGQVYYPSKYDDYCAEIVRYPEAIAKNYCKSEEEAVQWVEDWFAGKIR